MNRLLFLLRYHVLVAIGDGAAWIAARCYDRSERLCTGPTTDGTDDARTASTVPVVHLREHLQDDSVVLFAKSPGFPDPREVTLG